MKLKNEFKECGINFNFGVSFEDIEKWIDFYEHRINAYLFGADFVLKKHQKRL